MINFFGIKNKIDEIQERDKKIKNPFKHMKTELDKSSKTNKLRLRKYVFYFFAIFIIINIVIYLSLYKVNVLSASKNFKESRISFTNASMFQLYYLFFVKSGIDFKSKLLTPLVVPRDHFYKKGLDSLPKDDAEGAIWFDTFEATPYIHTVKGELGNMSKLYGVVFTKKFTEKIFDNIEILSTKWLYEYSNFKELQIYTVEKYVGLMNLYINEFEGGLIGSKKQEKARTNKEWYIKLKKLYTLQNNFFTYYQKYYPNDYNRTIDKNKSYYSVYADLHINRWILTTTILRYEEYNGLLSKKSLKYLNTMIDSREKVHYFMFKGKKPTLKEQSNSFGMDDTYIQYIQKIIEKRGNESGRYIIISNKKN